VVEKGLYKAKTQSEDWHFSKQVRALGGSVWATRKVAVGHIGRADYMNNAVWGTEETDPTWKEA